MLRFKRRFRFLESLNLPVSRLPGIIDLSCLICRHYYMMIE